MTFGDFELPKARRVTAVSFLYLSKAGKTMVFPLKSKPPWLPASAANRISLNSYQVTVWFPKEARHIQTFGELSRKWADEVYKPFRYQALLLSFFTEQLVYCEYLLESLLSTWLFYTADNKTHRPSLLKGVMIISSEINKPIKCIHPGNVAFKHLYLQ